MNEDVNQLDPSRKPAAMKKLANDLAEVTGQDAPALAADDDMLSLIVNGVLHQEDISQRYPAFYRRLLENADLRQAFVDALASIEAERAGELTPLPNAPKAGPDFMRGQSLKPFIEVLDQGGWRVTWERTAQELQTLFSPPEMAYRSDASLFEDPWFTLLRGEVDVEGCTFAIVLECSLADKTEEALAAFMILAVIQPGKAGQPSFPLLSSLHWGTYEASVLITEEGRTRFPEIPLGILLEAKGKDGDTGLSLTLENTS